MSELVFEKENLPEGWVKTDLENICLIILGQSPPSITYNTIKDGLAFFQGKSDFGELYPKTRVWCSTPKKIAEKDDLLLSVRAPVGSTNISKEQCCIGRGLAAIRPMDRNMNVMFFIHFFRWVENYLENQGTGTTFKAVSGKQIRELKISLPPLNEQKRIVSKIESIFTQIDASRISLDRIKVLLKQNRQSILKSAFEGKLVPQNPDDEPVEILLKRMHKDSKQELVFEKDVPKRWIKTKLDNLCELIGGGTPSRQNFEYFGEDILWLTPTEIPKNKIVKIYDSREKITTLGLEKSSAKIIPKNSVLLTSRASIGYVAIAGTEVTTNQGFASFVYSLT